MLSLSLPHIQCTINAIIIIIRKIVTATAQEKNAWTKIDATVIKTAFCIKNKSKGKKILYETTAIIERKLYQPPKIIHSYFPLPIFRILLIFFFLLIFVFLLRSDTSLNQREHLQWSDINANEQPWNRLMSLRSHSDIFRGFVYPVTQPGWPNKHFSLAR